MKSIFYFFISFFCFLANVSACQENMVLKFSDGKYDCIDRTIFVNIKATLWAEPLPFSIERMVKALYSAPATGKNTVLAVSKDIKECTASQDAMGTIWGRSHNKGIAISKCEKNSKATNGAKCSCELLDEIASKLTEEEFDLYQLQYAKKYATSLNIPLSNLTINTKLLQTYLAGFTHQEINNLTKSQNESLSLTKADSRISSNAIADNLINVKPEAVVNPSNETQTTQVSTNLEANIPIKNPTTTPLVQALSNRKRALVIGNDSYHRIQKLINAREDAKAISASLSDVGYEVTLNLDLNEREMKAAIRTFASQVQGGDEVVFFFAGHGIQLGSANFLLPIDIAGENEIQVRDESISLQRILEDMQDRKARFTLAMIDACRDNPFIGSGRSIGGRGLSATSAATGQMVIYSAGAGQKALDNLGTSDKSRNSLFTRVFVREMKNKGIPIDRILKNVRNEVVELARRVGHEQVPAIYDQVVGDFYFSK